MTTPWLAYSLRCGASTNTGIIGSQPRDHATVDGLTTLCGRVKNIGHAPETEFDPTGSYSCKWCARKVRTAQ